MNTKIFYVCRNDARCAVYMQSVFFLCLNIFYCKLCCVFFANATFGVKETHTLPFIYSVEDNAWTSLLEIYTIHLTILSRSFLYSFTYIS